MSNQVGTLQAGSSVVLGAAAQGMAVFSSPGLFSVEYPIGTLVLDRVTGPKTIRMDGGAFRIYGITGTISYLIDGGEADLSQLFDENGEIDAEVFGLRPVLGYDNTEGFAALSAWRANIPERAHRIVKFQAGDYYAKKIEILPPNDGLTSSVLLYGVETQTTFRALVSTEPVFCTIYAAFIFSVRFSGIRFQGAGAANPNQDGFAVVSVGRAIDDSAGITAWNFNDLQFENFDGQPCWMRGGQRSTGLYAFKMPNQFGFMKNNWFNNTNHRHAFETIGQFGQVEISGSSFDGTGAFTSGGAGLVISCDYRWCAQTPTTANTGTNTFTGNFGWGWPHTTPCRLIGANLPGNFAKGVTYWGWMTGADGASNAGNDFKVSSSAANAGSEIPVTISSVGTPGNYTFVPLWATSLANGTFETNLPHKLITGDKQRFLGANLPSLAALATDYFVIRVDHLRWKLASSEANAKAGIAIAMSGGVPSDYGFVANDGTPAGLIGPYAVTMTGPTIQTRRQALFSAYGNDINIRLHIEDVPRVMHLIEGVYSVNGGSGGNAGVDSGKGIWIVAAGSNCRVGVGAKPSFVGPPDKLWTLTNNAVLDIDQAQPAMVGGNWPTTQTTGDALQVGQSGGAIDIGANKRIFVNTSGTTITTINSKHTVGTVITLTAWAGSIVIGTGGGIRMSTATLTIPDGGSVRLERWDTIATWVLVSKSF